MFEVNSRKGECHSFPSTTEDRAAFYVYENVIKVMRIHARKLSLVAMSREPEKGVWGGGRSSGGVYIYMYI